MTDKRAPSVSGAGSRPDRAPIMLTRSALSWEQFLAATNAYTPETFRLSHLKALARRLEVGLDLLEGRLQFCSEAYARNLVFRNALFEAVCLCWQDDQRTSVHNHGRSYGVVRVLQGAMREEIFRRQEGDRVVATHALEHGPGELAAAPVGMIHRLGNAGGKGTRLVTLHFYAGPLDEMDVFDLEAGTSYRRPMRYLSDGELPPTS